MDKTLQVLMLEDEPADAEFAERELRKAGIVFQARRVDTRDGFVAAFDAFRPDIILADYKLPAFDGLAALGIAREKAPDVPFIFVSGAMGEEFAIETLHQGAADYVLKGHLSKLVPAINRALQDAEERRRRKEAEASLRESEERFRTVADYAGDWEYWEGPQGKILYMSPSCESLTGYAREEFMSDPGLLDRIVHPEDRSTMAAHRHDVSNNTASGQLDFRIVRRDGNIRWIAHYCAAVRGEMGRYNGRRVNNRDITERKWAEKEREEYFTFFNTSTDLMGIADPNGCFKKINPTFSALLGYSEAEILARPFIEFIHPDDRQSTLNEMARQLERGFSLDFENRYVCKDGSFRWLSWRANINPAEGLTYATARDVTERKQAEEALRISEERWKFALEGAGDGVWDWNVQTGAVNFSRRWKEMLGYAENEIGNSFDEWQTRVHPEDKSRSLACMQAYFDGARPDYVIEHRLACRDGSWKWILTRGMVVSRTADGKPLRMIGTHSDITEHKRMEAELREMATTDFLTGLYTRRHFMARMEEQLARVQRHITQTAAVLMLDLDYFKRINDTHGHATGDAVLRHFAALISDGLRKIDTVGRIGGEEFGIILPGADSAAAQVFAERLRKIVAETPFEHGGGLIPVTVSIGIVTMSATDTSVDAALILADKALYRAKEGGRNRVVVVSDSGLCI